MTNHEKYQVNSSEICRMLHSLGYTPHSIVEEAYNENMDVFDYIIVLFELYNA